MAAVAAINTAVAEQALRLIEVDYEVLPHVIDVDEAMQPDAPLLFEDMITRGVDPAPGKPSNISKRMEFKIGDLEAGTHDLTVTSGDRASVGDVVTISGPTALGKDFGAGYAYDVMVERASIRK